MVKVLVTYATKHRATEQIADMIAAVLHQEIKLNVEVHPVETVTNVNAYDVVILGSAIYAGQWLPAAAAFLQKHENTLAQRLVWIFSSGPIGEGDPQALIGEWIFPSNLQPVVDRIKPQDVIVFSGSLDLTALSVLEQSIIKGMQAPTGDYRDWVLIRQWAQTVASKIQAAQQNSGSASDYSVDWV